jgi:hypothetical protein
MPLSETTLLGVAGDRVFARGEDYVRYVRGLRVTTDKAHASVQAKRVYTVELDWSGPLPAGSCTCLHHADGHFCKHLVAVGLAVIDRSEGTADVTPESAVQAAVEAMDVHELRDLVMMLAQRDGEVRRMLEVRATTESGDDTAAKVEFESYVRNALQFYGFIDYRESYAVAETAGQVLDELENHLNDGAAEIVRPALLSALTLLRSITEHADDSSGAIGGECQRAAELYARACRQGAPDPVELAIWLVRFRADSRDGRIWRWRTLSTRSTTTRSLSTAGRYPNSITNSQKAIVGTASKSTPCCWSSLTTTAMSIGRSSC